MELSRANTIKTHDGKTTVTVTEEEMDRALLALKSCGFSIYLENDTTEKCDIEVVSLHVMDWGHPQELLSITKLSTAEKDTCSRQNENP